MIPILRTKTSFFRSALVLFGTVFFLALGSSLSGDIVEGAGQAAKQPTAAITISGTISYCAATVPPGAANTTVNLTGDAASSTSTGAAPSTGNYSFTNLLPGSYVVTPTKTGAVSGITSLDAARIQQHILNNPPLLTACQQLAADVNLSTTVTSLDAAFIQQFILNVMPVNPANHTGEWRFNPANRTYISIVSDQVNQNFDARLLGDVNGSWTPAGPTPNSATPSSEIGADGLATARPASDQGSVAANLVPQAPLAQTVTLPTASVSPTNSVGSPITNFSLPITLNVNTTPFISFDFDITFDPTVIGFQSTAVTASGLTASNWSVSGSVIGGNLLRISGFATSVTPISGTGTLLTLNLVRLGGVGTLSPLTWVVKNFDDVPATSVNGSISVNAAPTAIALSSFKAAGYDNGVYLNWKSGFEAENLGFNIYREVAGKRTLVTPDLVAGSALRTGASTKLAAGQSYGWWDKSAGEQQDARYWLEEVDINGLRTMHGPFDVHRTGGKPPRESQAALLSQVGRAEPGTHQLALSYEPGRPDARSAVSAQAVTASPLKLASMPAVKMAIREEGWYRVTQQELAATGFDTRIDPRRLQLYVNGVEQSMLVSGERDGGFGAIEFFATGQDTVSSDAHVYWLVSGDRPGKRVGVVNGETNGGGAPSFAYTVERRDRSIYFSGLRNGDAENFFGQVITSNAVSQTVTVPHLDASSGGAAQVEIALQGGIDVEGSTDHQVRVLLNGANLGWISFDGLSHKIQKFNVSPGILKDGDNVFTLAGEASNRDISLVDYIRVTYQHRFISDQDVLRLTANGPQTIDGFSNAAIRIFDITDPGSAAELTGSIGSSGDKFSVGVAAPAQGARTLLALTDDRVKRPASITANQPSNLKNKKNKANYLVIAPREFFSSLEPIRTLRESQGLRVVFADVEDIFDEFSAGEKTPQAIKDFLAYATTTWKKAPRFVLLAGHASLDPNNHLGLGDSDLVPTKLIDTDLMETAFDSWFGDLDNDGVEELAMGRLPFRTADEAATMVSKIISYEAASASSEALLVADSNDDFDFESASSEIRGLMPSNLKANQINRGRMDAGTAKAQLIDAINRGQKLVNYIGHGSTNQWKADLLTNEDALALTNGGRLSLFVMMTCLNGYAHDAGSDSLGESLLKAARGGAAAVWASSGMTSPNSQTAANRELYRLLFGLGQKLTLGEAVMRAKASAPSSDVRRTWILLGDPAMRMK